jgi:phosphate-selective porin OprO and OprP
LVQADGRFFAEGGGMDTFAVRRARLDLRATLYEYFGLRLHPELAGSQLSLLDAYGTVGFIDEVELLVGKTKAPIGLELLQNPSDYLFPETGLPSSLIPNRDVGVMVQGELFGSVLSYAVGVFNGTADGATGEVDNNNSKDFVGRLFAKPFAKTDIKPLHELGAGFAASSGKQVGALGSYRSAGRETFFAAPETTTADGSHTRLSPQGYYYVGPVGLLGEYVRSTQQVTDGTVAQDFTASSWQVLGSFVLGGQAAYKGTKVNAPLDPKAGTWGALELGARYGELSVDDALFAEGLADDATAAQSAQNFGVVLNWWLHAGTRVQLALDRTTFSGGAATGDRETESVIVARLQVEP